MSSVRLYQVAKTCVGFSLFKAANWTGQMGCFPNLLDLLYRKCLGKRRNVRLSNSKWTNQILSLLRRPLNNSSRLPVYCCTSGLCSTGSQNWHNRTHSVTLSCVVCCACVRVSCSYNHITTCDDIQHNSTYSLVTWMLSCYNDYISIPALLGGQLISQEWYEGKY